VRAISHDDKEYTDRWDIGYKKPFNLEAIRANNRPVFVVEGVIDALSIIEAGGAAVGLSGTDGIGEFIEALKGIPFSNCLLLAADNDESGRKANNEWAEKLKEIGVACVFVDTAKLFDGKKDANDALIADRAGFEVRVMEAEAHKAQLENPRGRSMLALEKALQNGDLKRYPTHVEVIDDLFNGGLSKKKLIVLGGQTGSSKTAFVQWWIESQAMKNPKFTALLFNFEMDTETLMARSISRILHDSGQSVTFNEVCDGHPQAQKGIELYKQKIGSRVEYYYGIRSKEAIVKIIRENVAYNAANGLDTPFIVCDYLQIMPSKESDERLAINASMEWLQDIAKDYNTVVIAITSMNRQTNNDTNDKANPLNGASGSGRIEYDADFFLTIEGKEEKRVTMHKGRMVKPGTYKKLTFLGQYMTFVYKKDKPLEKTSYGEAVQSLLSGRELTRKETKVANDLTLKMPY
jgi:replicative DNA helicase